MNKDKRKKKMLLKKSALTLIAALYVYSPLTMATASAAAELYRDGIFSRGGTVYVGQTHQFSATHSYSVINNNTSDVSYKICYSIVVCPNIPPVTESTQQCFTVTVAPGKFSTASGVTTIQYKFKPSSWQYVCRIYADTEISGAEYGDKKDIQRFTVKP